MKPLNANIDILAVDPAEMSGAALFRGGKLVECAEVPISSHMVESWICAALLPAIEARRALVLVGESGMAMWHGQRSAWKRWLWALQHEWHAQLEAGCIRQPAPKHLTVHVSTWRSKIFGGKVGAEVAKKMAVTTARERFGAQILDHHHNAAEAVCIGFWAIHAPKVRSVVAKRWR